MKVKPNVTELLAKAQKTKRRIPAVASFLSGKVGDHAKVQDKIISRAQKETKTLMEHGVIADVD